MSHRAVEDILRLSIQARLEIVEEIWDSIACDPEAFALTDQQREELERRVATADADPMSGSSWQAARERILRSRR